MISWIFFGRKWNMHYWDIYQHVIAVQSPLLKMLFYISYDHNDGTGGFKYNTIHLLVLRKFN